MKKTKSKYSKLLKYPGGGELSKTPIQTTDPNAVRAYNDSLQLYNLTKGYYDALQKDMVKGALPQSKVDYHLKELDRITPKTDSLSNDLRSLGINYKIKGYNTVPVQTDTGIDKSGKLQKVAPMPKQPYFFKNGGKLKYSMGGSIATGFATGAATGALAGAPAGGIGAIPGAVIGGIAGGIGGFFKGKQEQEVMDQQQQERLKSSSLLPSYNSNALGTYKNGGELIKYNTGSHKSGKDQMVNKLGVEVNNPNSASGIIEKTETSKGGFVFSDTLGLNKDKQIELNSKKVKTTFSDLSRKIDKKFGGRSDELSEVTKNLMYKDLQNKNEQAIQTKFERAYKSFSKKYGGMISQYPLGGILSPEVDPNESYIFPDTNPDYYNQDISPIDNSVNPRLLSNPSMSYLPQNNKLIQAPQAKLNPLDTNPINAQKLAQDTPEGINYADYLSPAFNTLASGISLFSKGKNYLEKPNTEALSTLQSIPIEVDNQQLLNRNQRSLRAANSNASNYSPSIRNSLLANNLGTKLNADNEIGFATNKERLDRETNKKSMIAQLQESNNRYRQGALHAYTNEGLQDKAMREDKALQFLGNAVQDVQAIKQDRDLLKLIPQALKYYNYSPETNQYTLKNPGWQFSLNLPPAISKTK